MQTKYNPEGSPLRNHQLQLLELLLEFDALCAENGITWWLDGGTLLGAARHGGFIPWDDDLDVCILWKDLPKIRRILKEKTPAPYAFVDRKGTRGYTRLWPRFVDTSKTITRLDPTTGLPKEDTIWMDCFVVRPGSAAVKKRVDFLYGRCMHRITGMIDDGCAKRIAAWLLLPLALIGVGLVDLGGRLFHRGQWTHDFGVPFYSTRTKKETFPLGKISFEGHEFPAPADTDAYLRRIYGNWKQLPPEDQRINHEILL